MKHLLSFLLIFLSILSNAQTNDKISLYFEFNSSTLNSAEMTKLKSFMNDDSHGEVMSVTAYCDTVGTTNYNERLAKKRLESVLNVLNLKSTTARTNINGEREASTTSNYDAKTARRVDIIYAKTTEAAPISTKTKGAEKLANSFEFFLSSEDDKASFDLSLLFIPGYPVLIKDSERELEELFQLLKDNPTIDAHIHGHVCCADDYKLSYDRALMVYQYLTKKGIAKGRLEFQGHSNRDPKISPETSESDRLANRRVTVDFTKK